MLTAIAFDLDGTLVDSVQDLTLAANAVRESFGLDPLPVARIQSFVGDGVVRLIKRSLTNDSGAELPEPMLVAALERFHAWYGEHLADNTTTYTGVREALQRLHGMGIPLAVVTNKPERHSRALLQGLGLASYFTAVIGGDTLPTRKPQPEPLLEAARLLGVDSAGLLMIGDSENDILSARAAGCPVWAVSYGYADARGLAADRIIDSLMQIVDGDFKHPTAASAVNAG